MSQRIQSLGPSVLHIPDAGLRLELGQQVTVPTLTHLVVQGLVALLAPPPAAQPVSVVPVNGCAGVTPSLTPTTIGSALRILPPVLPQAEADRFSARLSPSAVGASEDMVITREGWAWCNG